MNRFSVRVETPGMTEEGRKDIRPAGPLSQFAMTQQTSVGMFRSVERVPAERERDTAIDGSECLVCDEK